MRLPRFVQSALHRLFGTGRPAPLARGFSLDGKDREEWDRAWRATPHRRLAPPFRFDLDPALRRGWGDPVGCTLSLDPPRFCDGMWRCSACCPVCGEPTSPETRLPASLHPRWAKGASLGLGAWVHKSCFEDLDDAGAPTPIPW